MGAWYKEFYLTTEKGEQDIKAAISDAGDGAANRADIERRLAELKAIPEDRCHISRDQVRFLERVLNAQ